MAMQYCPHCQRNVRPDKAFGWLPFIFCFGVFYCIYYAFVKKPRCPICQGEQFESYRQGG